MTWFFLQEISLTNYHLQQNNIITILTFTLLFTINNFDLVANEEQNADKGINSIFWVCTKICISVQKYKVLLYCFYKWMTDGMYLYQWTLYNLGMYKQYIMQSEIFVLWIHFLADTVKKWKLVNAMISVAFYKDFSTKKVTPTDEANVKVTYNAHCFWIWTFSFAPLDTSCCCCSISLLNTLTLTLYLTLILTITRTLTLALTLTL